MMSKITKRCFLIDTVLGTVLQLLRIHMAVSAIKDQSIQHPQRQATIACEGIYKGGGADTPQW